MGAAELVELVKIPVPSGHKIAVDWVSSKAYIEKNHEHDPIILTWVNKQRRIIPELEVIPTEIDEIQKLIADGFGVAEKRDAADEGQDVQEQARQLISMGAKYGANNIHMMMRGSFTEIHFTIKGTNLVYKKLSQEIGVGIARAIYQGLAQVRDASWIELDTQNAIINATPEVFDPSLGLDTMRVMRGPSHPVSQGGSFMSIRLQYRSTAAHKRSHAALPALQTPKPPEGSFRLADLGFSASQVEKMYRLLRVPNGMIVVTGPTGHGKTTTLIEMLTELARLRPGGRQVTVEDPPEYDMPWAVRQVITNANTEEEAGAQYANKVRAALRMEPRAFFLGELRGAEVALAAIHAVLSGHTVWTTNHAIDPYLFPDRLETLDPMRLDKKVFCDSKIVRAIIAQRLVPLLCPDCSVPIDTSAPLGRMLVDALRSWGDVKEVKVRGSNQSCTTCSGHGVLGLSAVAEVVITDDELMTDFITLGSSAARTNYRRRVADADPSMLESAISLALQGKVDPSDIEEHVELITPKPVVLKEVKSAA